MSALDIEVIPTEGIDLDSAPPCQIHRAGDGVTPLCGLPSVARVIARCRSCGEGGAVFICTECLEMLISGDMECTACRSIDYAWRES